MLSRHVVVAHLGGLSEPLHMQLDKAEEESKYLRHAAGEGCVYILPSLVGLQSLEGDRFWLARYTLHYFISTNVE